MVDEVIISPCAEESCVRLRLLRRLLVVLMPSMVGLLLIRGVIGWMNGESTRNMVVTCAIGMTALVVIYLTSRTDHYTITVWVALLIGTAAILMTVSLSKPPYIAFAYFAFLPLLGAAIFSLRQYIMVSLFSVGALLASSRLVNGTVPLPVLGNWVVFLSLIEVGFFLSILHRLSLEAERRRLEDERSRLVVYRTILGHLHHDFRTPLTTILSCSQLARDPALFYERDAFLEQIDHQAENLVSVVEKVLLTAELDTRQPPESLAVDLVPPTRVVCRRLQDIALEKGIALDLHLPDCLTGAVDPVDWGHILGNLLENAIKFTGTGGRVDVSLARQADRVMLEVTDTGIGIPEEDLPHVFDYFYRADKARSTVTGGSGLGLAIVKRQVELYGGQIVITSAVGRGTTCRIAFPSIERKS